MGPASTSREKFLQISILLENALKLVNKSSYMAQVLFILRPLSWDSGQVVLCAGPFTSRVSISYRPLALPE